MIYTRSSFALIVLNTFNSFFDAGGFVWFSAKEMFAWLLYMRGSHEHRRALLRIFLLIEVHGIIWSAEYQLVIACIEYAVIRIALILSTWEQGFQVSCAFTLGISALGLLLLLSLIIAILNELRQYQIFGKWRIIDITLILLRGLAECR